MRGSSVMDSNQRSNRIAQSLHRDKWTFKHFFKIKIDSRSSTPKDKITQGKYSHKKPGRISNSLLIQIYQIHFKFQNLNFGYLIVRKIWKRWSNNQDREYLQQMQIWLILPPQIVSRPKEWLKFSHLIIMPNGLRSTFISRLML